MGYQDEQRKNFIKPPMSLPSSRSPRRNTPPPSPSSTASERRDLRDESVELPPARPKVTGRGGQFRPLPRFGLRRDASRDDLPVGEPSEEIDAEWEDRFEARHAPRDSRKRSGQRDDGRAGDRSYADDAWQSRGQAAYDDGWDDDRSDYAPAPQRDPWRRDWAQWTSMDLQVDDILDYPGDEFDGGWSRDAWGGEPNPYTLASVALHVELPPPPGKGRAAKPALQQFIYWAQKGFKKSARPTKKAMRVLTIMSVLFVMLMTTIGTGLTGLVDYLSIKGLASDAVSSLSHLGDDLGLGKHKNNLSDAERSAAANADVSRALNDMEQLHDRLAHPDFILSMAGRIGKVREMLQSGLVLSQVGIEGITMIQTLLPTLVSLAKVISTSPISTDATTQDNTQLLYDSDIQKIISNIEQIKPMLDSMIATLQATPPQTLVAALNSKQQSEILPLLQGLPYLKQSLPILQEFLSLKSAGTLLGIDHGPIAYLLMTLDNAEIRPVGGFQGQYALIGVNGGRISHIALQDTYHYLEPLQYSGPGGQKYWEYDNLTIGPEAWYGLLNLGWAMRNSGLSPDFPQSARYALWYLHNEETCVFDNPNQVAGQNGIYCSPPCPVGASTDNGVYKCMPGGDRLPIVDAKGQVQGFEQDRVPMAGVIMIQSNIIAQLLQITGPLKIGCPYYTTVDATTLEQKIHFYQETYRGKHISETKCPTQISDSTKRFTGLLTQVLQQKLKDMPKGKLLQFIGDIVQDLHNKEIQIFFTDPVHPGNIGPSAFANGYNPNTTYPADPYAEGFLRKYQISSELYQGNDDSLALNRADDVGWKFEPFVKVKLIDHIKIDAQGNAIHSFQTEYDINVPPIKFFPKPGMNLSNDNPLVQNAVYNVVYNAAFQRLYQEVWRVYMSGRASPQVSSGQYVVPSTSGGEDVPNRSYVWGYFEYQWNFDSQTNQIDWSPVSGFPPPALSWVVPNAVEHGRYIIHVQPQSGVNTSAEIDITLPNGKTCNEMNGALPQNRVFAVNVSAGTC